MTARFSLPRFLAEAGSANPSLALRAGIGGGKRAATDTACEPDGAGADATWCLLLCDLVPEAWSKKCAGPKKGVCNFRALKTQHLLRLESSRTPFFGPGLRFA